MSKYFIAGIPGTRKTSIGKYLASQRGFEHIELEDGQYHFDSEDQIEEPAKKFIAKKNNTIVT
jgi:broad-specificity NMP kinase